MRGKPAGNHSESRARNCERDVAKRRQPIRVRRRQREPTLRRREANGVTQAVPSRVHECAPLMLGRKQSWVHTVARLGESVTTSACR